MRIKRVSISPEIIPDFFRWKDLIRVSKPLPADAKLLRATYDSMHDMYYLIFESAEWPEVIEGAAIEEFTPEFEKVYSEDINEKITN